MDLPYDSRKTAIPLTQRDTEYYRLHIPFNNLPPGTDDPTQLVDNPRHPRPPSQLRRAVPELPPEQARRGKWIDEYLSKLDPETEYDQIVRISTFYRGSDFNTALGYAAVFIWLTTTPAGANAIHGGKVITRGHQRYYETQEMNLNWVTHGSSSPETIKYVEQVNKIHAGVWAKVPGAFSFAWEAQAAIVLLSWYEHYIRGAIGASNDINPQLKKAWPAWGERVTGHFRSEPANGSSSFGDNYPRTWEELDAFVEWYQAFDFQEQCTEEDRVKARETAEAFIHQFCELWFPRALHWLGRAYLLTFVPPRIRRKQGLEDPNTLLELVIKKLMKLAIDYQDSRPDPAVAPMDEFFANLKSWDMNKVDEVETRKRDAQTRHLQMALVTGLVIVTTAIVLSYKVR